jgi:hypothetical protein
MGTLSGQLGRVFHFDSITQPWDLKPTFSPTSNSS